MRENTYWPDLCLIQIADARRSRGDRPARPTGIDLTPLLDLLVDNEDVLKVFHAGGQDLEIIHNLTGKTPHPLFDTQIAAMALGLWRADRLFEPDREHARPQPRQGRALHRLVRAARSTSARSTMRSATSPISPTIFPKMVDKLQQDRARRLARRGDGAARRSRRTIATIPPEDAWKRLKLPSRNPQVLGRLKALAAWRETEARDKNLPRGRIVKDETLADIAGHPPKTQEDLGKVRGLSAGWRNNDIGARLMAALAKAEPLDPRRAARARAAPPRPDQGRRAGRRPAQAAAQDPRQGDRRRVAS